MTRDEIRTTVVQSLRSVAPESDPNMLDPNANLREELDLDSMDFLRFVTALYTALHVEIPETDYRKLATLREAEDYLSSKLS